MLSKIGFGETEFGQELQPRLAPGAMAEETWWHRAAGWSTLRVATAGGGKRDTAEPLVLSDLSPDKSLVPGRARKSLVTLPRGSDPD
jgi:hypothetical protein